MSFARWAAAFPPHRASVPRCARGRSSRVTAQSAIGWGAVPAASKEPFFTTFAPKRCGRDGANVIFPKLRGSVHPPPHVARDHAYNSFGWSCTTRCRA